MGTAFHRTDPECVAASARCLCSRDADRSRIEPPKLSLETGLTGGKPSLQVDNHGFYYSEDFHGASKLPILSEDRVALHAFPERMGKPRAELFRASRSRVHR